MSLYVNFENQSLLWNIIHKNQYALHFFSKTPNLNKEDWFKTIIQHFYSQNQQRNLTINELQKLNQDTLLFMLESIRTKMNEADKNEMESSFRPMHNNTQNTIQNNENVISPKSSISSQTEYDFNNRQKAYEQMLEKKIPENVNFKDVVADQAISNMDEVLRQHIQQREAELRAYAPAPISTPSAPIFSTANTLKIDNSTENIKLVVDEVSNVIEQKPKKVVTWTTNTEHEITNENFENNESKNMHYEEFLFLKQQVLEMNQKILVLEEELGILKSKLQ